MLEHVPEQPQAAPVPQPLPVSVHPTFGSMPPMHMLNPTAAIDPSVSAAPQLADPAILQHMPASSSAGWTSLPEYGGVPAPGGAAGYPATTLPWSASAGWAPDAANWAPMGMVPPVAQRQPTMSSQGSALQPAEVRAELRSACMAEDFNRIQAAVQQAESLGMMDEAARGGRRLAQLRMHQAMTMNQQAQAQAGLAAMAAAAEGWQQARAGGGPVPTGVPSRGFQAWLPGSAPAPSSAPSHHPKGSANRLSLDDDDVLGLVQEVEEQRLAEDGATDGPEGLDEEDGAGGDSGEVKENGSGSADSLSSWVAVEEDSSSAQAPKTAQGWSAPADGEDTDLGSFDPSAWGGAFSTK